MGKSAPSSIVPASRPKGRSRFHGRAGANPRGQRHSRECGRPGSNLDAAHLFDHVRRGGREFRQAGSDEAARSARRTSDRICDAGPRIKSLESLDRGTALTARKLVHANLSSVELSVTTYDHYCWRHPFLDRPGRRSGGVALAVQATFRPRRRS